MTSPTHSMEDYSEPVLLLQSEGQDGDSRSAAEKRHGPQCCFRAKPIQSARPLEGSMHFSITKHQKEVFEHMNHLRQSGDLCDITLIAGTETCPAHKMVLAAASPYFRAMFCGGMKECGMSEIRLQGIKPNILATLVDFIYTAELHVSELNVCALLPAATMFHLSHVVDACSTFLEHQLDASNCIGIADFAQAHGCHDLYNKARQFLYNNFTEVYQHEEFMQLSQPQLMQVIKRDDLNVRCESEVYMAVMRWVMYSECKRLNKMEFLLSGVRCHFLTPCFLKQQLKYCDVLKKMPTCHEFLRRISEDLAQHRWVKEKRRCPPAPPVIYVIGGYLRHSLTNVECFNPTSKEWHKLSDLPTPRSGLAACCVHGLIYVMGGRNNSPDSNLDSAAVDCYDPMMNMWRKCTDMTVPRHRVGAGCIDGMLYAVGGSNGSETHNSVEKYDPTCDTWKFIKPMRSKRIGVGVAVANRLLYAIGGYDGTSRLQCVECYHPEKEKWLKVSSMHTPRSGAGVLHYVKSCLNHFQDTLWELPLSCLNHFQDMF